MNPAERLLQILQDARKASDDTKAFKVWSSVLHVPGPEAPHFVERFAELLGLVKDVEDQISVVKNHKPQLHLSWVGPVRAVLNPIQLHRDWRDLKGSLSDQVFTTLAFVAHALEELPQPSEFPEKELTELQKEVESLIKSLIASTLDPAVKSILIKQASNIHESILAYRVRGPEAIRKALESVVGSILLNGDTIRRAGEVVEVKRMAAIMHRLRTGLDIAVKMKELAAPLVTMLVDEVKAGKAPPG